MKIRFIPLLSFCVALSLSTACGDSSESMDDFTKRTCDKESYDCECYAKKVKAYFKTEEEFSKWIESSDEEFPDELIKLRGECSNDSDFDF